MATATGIVRRLLSLATDPARALALLRGQWYRFYLPLRGVHFRAGPRLHAYGRIRIGGGARVVIGRQALIRGELRIAGAGEITIGDGLESSGTFIIEGGGKVLLGDRVGIHDGLRIRGPGEVRVGDDVVVWEESTLRTHTPEARISVGARTGMLRAYITCVREIVIGRDCLIAPSKILDSDFHSTSADRRSPYSLVRVAPIHLEDNVWIGEQAALLAGTRIGRNSVVGFGAVCMRTFPEDVVIIGNPARVSSPIPTGAEESEPVPHGSEVQFDYITRGHLTGNSRGRDRR